MKKALKNVFGKAKGDSAAPQISVKDPSSTPSPGPQSQRQGDEKIATDSHDSLPDNSKTLVAGPRDHRIPPDNDGFIKACKDTINPPPAMYAFNKSNYRYVMKLLGQGSYASVKEAIKMDEKIHIAVKEISKQKMKNREERLRLEIEILLKMSHPNILHLLDWGMGKLTIYLVTELAAGGELFDMIIERGIFYEEDAALVAGTLFDAMSYVHELGIVHRDLKPENVLIRDPKKKDLSSVVIGDFGISRILGDQAQHLKTRIGSSGYMAPEVLMARPYSKPADIWSLGVITYILLTGTMPYRTPKHGGFDAELHNILNDPLPDDDVWKELSPFARTFVENCLSIEPNRRITAVEALKHPWITTFGPEKFRVSTIPKGRDTNIFSYISGGLAAEKMRIENIVDLPTSGSVSSLDSTVSGATSGWGTSSHSRAGSIHSDLDTAAISQSELQKALNQAKDESDMMEIY